MGTFEEQLDESAFVLKQLGDGAERGLQNVARQFLPAYGLPHQLKQLHC